MVMTRQFECQSDLWTRHLRWGASLKQVVKNGMPLLSRLAQPKSAMI